MSRATFILIDRDRAEQFRLLGSVGQLFHGHDVHQDAEGLPWVVRSLENHAFALSGLGEGWMFDAFTRSAWSAVYTRRRQELAGLTAAQQLTQLQQLVARWRCGRLSERLLWLLHEQVLAARRSVLKLPDSLLASAVWGARRPRHWRSELQSCLQSLTRLHVLTRHADAAVWGTQTALLTTAVDLRRQPDDCCTADCPGYLGPPHHHYQVNVGRGFLGVLEAFVENDRDGVRTYDFDRSGRRRQAVTLRRVGRSGQLISCFLPVELGEPARTSWTVQQRRLLQALVRETTRGRRPAGHGGRAEAEVLPDNCVPDFNGRGKLVCPFLPAGRAHVGFNGNKKRHGLGYYLCTSGGWLAKAGYEPGRLTEFLADLQQLQTDFGLAPIGVLPSGSLLDGRQLADLSLSGPGRGTLRQVQLRVYTAADYRERWAERCGWPPTEATTEPKTSPTSGAHVWRLLQERRRTQRELALALGKHPSWLSKLRQGVRPWPIALLQQAEAWLTTSAAGIAAPADRARTVDQKSADAG